MVKAGAKTRPQTPWPGLWFARNGDGPSETLLTRLPASRSAEVRENGAALPPACTLTPALTPPVIAQAGHGRGQGRDPRCRLRDRGVEIEKGQSIHGVRHGRG